MKTYITLLVLIIGSLHADAQIKVHSNGDIGVKNTTSTPRALLDINQLSVAKPQIQAGNLSVQSLYNNNALMGNNVSWSNTGATATENGDIAFMHFVGPYTFFRTFQGATAGQNIPSASFKNGIVVNRLGKVGINMTSAAPSAAYDLHVNGTAAKTSAGSDWVVISDKRLKKNIAPFRDGLETLMKINPVSYEYTGEGGTVPNELNIGLIAQEMNEVAPYTVRNYNYVPTEMVNGNVVELKSQAKDYLSLDNSPVRYILVNAVKEQQAIIDDNEKKISDLESKLEDLEKIVTTLLEGNAAVNEISISSDMIANLGQNIPNPHSGHTVISYSIPSDAISATMKVMDMNGQLVKSIAIDHQGEGQLNVNAEELAEGTYLYQLEVDGKVVDTKKMQKVR